MLKTSKTLKYGSSSVIFILVILGILALVNFLSERYFARADLTENNIYTISQSTKEILKELDDIINIRVYFSENPPQVAKIRREIRDMLDEYSAFSRGNLMIDFIDPADDEDLKQKLRFMGIPEIQVNVYEKDKAEVAKVYMGIAILYEDKKEALPVVQGTYNLEYDLTSAILKVSSGETKTLGFLTGHDEADIDGQGYEQLNEELRKQYDVKKVDLKKNDSALKDIDTLIVAGPKETISVREKYLIDQFLMRGGRAVFLIDPVKMQEGTLQATPLATGLNDMFESYGVKLGNNLVLDRSNTHASFRSGFMTYSLPYPYWPKVIKKNLSDEHVITNQLESIVLPWVSSLEITAAIGSSQSKEDTESGEVPVMAVELAKSTQYAWSAQSPYDLNPQKQHRPSNTKQFTLAVALSGNFKSFYADKAIPQVEPDENSEPDTVKSVSDEEKITESQEPTQIVVVGNSRFIQQSGTFFINSIEWMTLGDKLISIRSRAVTDRPLKEIGSGGRTLVKFIGTFLIPILVVIFGLMRFYLRRRAKRLYESYGN